MITPVFGYFHKTLVPDQQTVAFCYAVTILFLFLVTRWAEAATPVLADFVVEPSTLEQGRGKQAVTVSVNVEDQDDDLKTTSVKVKQRREGKRDKILARLNDKGRRGDEIAGDGLFSGQFKIKTRETGSIRLIVTAKDKAGQVAKPIERLLAIVDQLPVIQLSSSVLSDQDNTYPTGRLVRIDVVPPNGIDIVSGTIRITSESQGYDSGEQALNFGSIFYEWDTTGLSPAQDYDVKVELVTSEGLIIGEEFLVAPFTIALEPKPPLINKLVSDTDISVPARGLPVRVNRTYLLDSDFDGPLGHGWTHSYRMRVVETPTFTATLTPVDGTVQVFNADGIGSIFIPNGDGTYQSPKGDFRSLAKNVDGRYLLRQKFGTEFHFAANGKLFLIRDKNGNSLSLLYDGQDLLESVFDGSGQKTTFAYDGNNRISSIKGPDGREVKYEYDATGNLTSVTDVGGFKTIYEYDGDHNLTTIIDPASRKTFFTVDAEDRLASVSGIDGNNKQTFEYGVPVPDQMTITDALGNKTLLSYDNNASVTKIQDPLINISEFSYDDDLNLISATDANGNRTIFTYDARGNIASVQDPEGNTTQLINDPIFSQVTSITDGNGNKTLFEYDGKGNLETRVHPDGSTEILAYDVFGTLISLTDSKGNVTEFGYDTKDNLTSMIFPDGSSESYSYDAAGNLNSKIDRIGQKILYSVDPLGRLLKKTFPNTSSDTFDYDQAGNLTSATDENGSILFAYDDAGRLTKVNYPSGEEVRYDYDKAGNRSQLIYPDGTVLDYGYDKVNRLATIIRGGVNLATYQYDSVGRIERRALQNGTFTTYNYDKADQLLELVNRKSTNDIISRFGYTYDDVGNRLSMTTVAGTTQYVYDQINQLTRVIDPSAVTTDYNLDSAGNRIAVTEGGVITPYTTNDLNQYTEVNGEPYTYDDNGNLTSKTDASGLTTYSYDFENRLVQVDTPTETVNYIYDPLGRRIQKSTSAVTIKYFHDGLHVIMEKDGGGAVQATYVFGIRFDEVLAMRRTGVDYFYSQDRLGSVINLTDANENVVESFSYDAYGQSSNFSVVGTPYLFTGREFDEESGLYYYHARYYSSIIGRFIQRDPIGFAGGVNHYSYVQNNPLGWLDPQGLDYWIEGPGKGDGGLGFHQSVCVGKARGKSICIGFGSKQGLNIPFTGEIYWDNSDQGAVVAGTYRESSLSADRKIKDIFEGLIGTEGFYCILGSNCRDFARNIFNIIDKRFGDNPSEGGGDGGSDEPRDCTAESKKCTDSDGDGIPDSVDPDDDNDGIPDDQDPAPNCDADRALCAGDPTFVQLSRRSNGLQQPNWFESLFSTIKQDKDLVADIKVPFQDALVRADVPIFGLAHGDQFKSYRIEYGEGNNPTHWVTVAESAEPQDQPPSRSDLNDAEDTTIHGNLATWDTGLTNYVYLPSHPKDHPVNLKGTHTVRLVVTGQDGTEVEDRVTVDVGNVIPNAWGGSVRSPDGKLVVMVPEQALMDSFRLISAQAINQPPAPLPENKTLIGKVYEVREFNERFTKPAELQIHYPIDALVAHSPDQLGLYAYNPDTGQWLHQKSYRRGNDQAVHLKTRRLASHYALLAGDNAEEGSVALNDNNQPEATLRQVSMKQGYGHYRVNDSFEQGIGEWSNRDFEVGAKIARGSKATFDGSYALKISNSSAGGNFAVNVITTPFDAREYPLVQFDYRIPADVKTNFLVKVSGRWYDIGFTDDHKEFKDKRVNIAHIGDINDVVADDQWHTAQFNLYDMLRKKTGNTFVEAMIMADWDVGGYMKLQFGKNAKGVTYYLDNFTISREVFASLRLDGDPIRVDNFNQKKETNILGGYTSTFVDSIGGSLQTSFSEEDVNGKGHALALSYDVSQNQSYAGYATLLQNIDLRGYHALTLFVKGKEDGNDLMVGLKDRTGHEQKVPVSSYLSQVDTPSWRQATIPLPTFTNIQDWGGINNLSISFENAVNSSGTVLIDDITFHKELKSFKVDDFERVDKRNTVGREHWTFVKGAAAINGQHTKGSPNGIYRLSYGGNIGVKKLYASDLKSFAGWITDLGGIDCSQCGALSFRIRGAEGGENGSIYLDDGNFRWGIDIAKYGKVTTSWQTVTIPLNDFAEYGVDLTHLSEFQTVFEGEKMSGTIYLDDIQFGSMGP